MWKWCSHGCCLSAWIIWKPFPFIGKGERRDVLHGLRRLFFCHMLIHITGRRCCHSHTLFIWWECFSLHGVFHFYYNFPLKCTIRVLHFDVRIYIYIYSTYSERVLATSTFWPHDNNNAQKDNERTPYILIDLILVSNWFSRRNRLLQKFYTSTMYLWIWK